MVIAHSGRTLARFAIAPHELQAAAGNIKVTFLNES
jgi:hypothetical protein